MQELGLKIDCTDAVKAAEALERLAKAAEAAEAAIAKLNGQAHGGVVFQMVGDICKCEVLPVLHKGEAVMPSIARMERTLAKWDADGVPISRE